MPVNWNDKNVLERLFIAFLASVNNKIDIREVTRLYGGDGMTYDALEYHIRPWKEQATALKAGAAEYQASPRGSSEARTKSASASASPTKGVTSGRVTKKKPSAPRKIKLEAFADKPDFETDDFSVFEDEFA